MSNDNTNRIFTSPFLGRCIRRGIMPTLAVAMIAGTASAQESGGFGLLAALKNQAKANTADSPQAPSNEITDPTDEQIAQQINESGLDQIDPPKTHEEDLADLAGAVEVSDYDLVDLHVNNEDLGNILQLLSIQSQRNIISSKDVQATVTADLYGVTFYEALDAILHANGYGYIEKGNFIYVYTAAELADFEAAARKPITKVITLDYLNATDAGEFAKMLLSKTGVITTNAPTESFSITDGSPSGADTYANSATIVINDFEENIDEIVALIAELDTKPAQILIEATILQTTLNEANAFGMDFALIQNLNFNDFAGTGGPLSVVDGLIKGAGQTIGGTAVNAPNNGHGTGLSSSVGNTSGPGSLKAGFVNGDVGVFLKVLDQITDVTVVSNPKLLTLNRQPARVLVGTRVGYLNSTTTQTSTTQSVEFLDVGTQLAVRPFVSKNGLIRLELRPQVSSFTLRDVTDNAGLSVTIPDEDTTEMNTNILVHDGQTVVLGGLFTESTSSTRRQVPVLGDIPIIGTAFKGYDDQTRRSEIIFLITPTIVNDTVLTETGDMGNQYVEHARYGARKGLLPWSRDRRVGQLLIDARTLADNGKIEEALSKVDRALRLMPASPDARALRTELTNEHQTMPSRSMIQGILHNELHYGGKSQSLVSPNMVNPFMTPSDSTSSASAESQAGEVETFDPSSDEDHQSPSSFDDQPFVEVPTDSVSESISQIDPPSLDEPSTDELLSQTGSDSDDLEGIALDDGGEQIAAQDIQEKPVSEINPDEFDQMKSIVTGEQTAVDLFNPTQESISDPLQSSVALDDVASTVTEDGAPQSSVSVVAEEFSGQLIIPLPGGGALRLNWPLSFDYVADGTSIESQETFTEVPTDNDQFGDFNK